MVHVCSTTILGLGIIFFNRDHQMSVHCKFYTTQHLHIAKDTLHLIQIRLHIAKGTVHVIPIDICTLQKVLYILYQWDTSKRYTVDFIGTPPP